MKIITRFAPSPTGFLHIGGARTALFNYLFAKNQDGEFLLRIEDTDEKRSTQKAIEAIIDGLNWLGLKNEGKVILQSNNLERHKQIAQELLEKEQAYYCYTPGEELSEMRENATKSGQVFRFQSPWRDKQPSQNTTVKPVIRLKTPLAGESTIKDLIQGSVSVPNSEIDDLIILRSDKTPTYMLAVVVDDYDMNISHIIRGDDHLTNSFKQRIIYQAMGWKVPQFAHIPLIYGSDGSKMSKRHGATSVTDYQEMGYLPEAMRNYLLRLGWSHGDEEIISDEDAIKWFGLDKVGKSPSRFDFNKLDSLNKHYIKEKSGKELFNLILPSESRKAESWTKNQEKIIAALEFIKERAIKLHDLSRQAEIYQDGFIKELELKDSDSLKDKLALLENLKNAINSIGPWDHEGIKTAIKDFASNNNLKIKDFGPSLRIALTFSSSSAGGIFDVVEILGKNEVVRRLNAIK